MQFTQRSLIVMKRIAVIPFVALIAIVSGMAFADDDPVAARQQLMKQNGQAAKLGYQMAKGKIPFDAAAAAQAMNQIATDMETFPSLFPPGSDKAPKTTASSDIFANTDDFKALAAKLGADAKVAAAAAAQGVDAFSTAFDVIDHDCGACHRKYRTN
jgi:cytochrome c556